ncbi:hypothetical protein SBF1_1730004 [Candidatus Desulfosporosinus infrequens]|uniref:Uncharacterized protein n=1 Tax=Candidatus Desulfosporosinus infrequens TaxID=2043169 RepID=A0A2U3KBS7_9FIRM|nr:hypothetical protein SBF1_1730004 [Candidatus Desulfosporosinus infrequens]
MQTPNSLKNEKEVKIIRAIIAELKAENQKEMLKIQLLDQNMSKMRSGHMRSE